MTAPPHGLAPICLGVLCAYGIGWRSNHVAEAHGQRLCLTTSTNKYIDLLRFPLDQKRHPLSQSIQRTPYLGTKDHRKVDESTRKVRKK